MTISLKTSPERARGRAEGRTVPAVLEVEHLSVTFPTENGGLHTLQDVSFTLAPQEFAAVLGPSGSGKTTLLRVLGGLLPPTSGSVRFSFDAERPRIGFVFQQANLMPWRSVLDNIALPLELQGIGRARARVQAQRYAEWVGLAGFERAWPAELSGGMAQRVALARALILEPDLLLMDEPFAALDAITREQMGFELLRIWQERRITVILVTHSIEEALFLSDRVLVLSQRPGRIVKEVRTGFPRPRVGTLRYSDHFLALEKELREAIGSR